MRHTKITLLFLALLALAVSSCAKLQARDNLNKGVQAFKDTHYEKSVDYFKKAIELDPDLTSAELYLGTAYSQQFVPGGRGEDNDRNAKLAIQTFEDVLKHDSSNVNAVAGLAGIYQNTNDFKKAHEYYLKYAQLDSTNPIPYYSIGSLDWGIVFDKNNTDSKEDQVKLIDEGLGSLDKALSLKPDYEDAMTFKNLLFRQKADRSDNEDDKKKLTAMADEWFNKALDTRKKNAEKKQAVGGN
jgi:tetratricopeptide (TPR) repeat protein